LALVVFVSALAETASAQLCAPASPYGTAPSSLVNSICIAAEGSMPAYRVNEAIARWQSNCSAVGSGIPAFAGPGTGSCTGNAIYVTVTMNFSPGPDGYDAQTRLFPGNGGPITGATITCFVNVCSADLLSHELGHILGLGDTNEPACANTIMSQQPSGSRNDFTDGCAKANATWTGPTDAPPPPPPPPPPFPEMCDPGHCDGNGTSDEPLILDLNGDGVQTTSIDASPVVFDMNGDGIPDETAWTNPTTEEGFLFFDSNRNGIVDGNQELFGDATLLRDGNRAKTGFAALAAYDLREYGGNEDGRITPGDKAWGILRVWVDRNHDGIATRDETYALGELGIEQIFVAFRQLGPSESYGLDASGNYHALKGEYIRRINRPQGPVRVTRDIDDVYFTVRHH
jgi:hypothetical protein